MAPGQSLCKALKILEIYNWRDAEISLAKPSSQPVNFPSARPLKKPLCITPVLLEWVKAIIVTMTCTLIQVTVWYNLCIIDQYTVWVSVAQWLSIRRIYRRSWDKLTSGAQMFSVLLGPVVQKPISINPGLTFYPMILIPTQGSMLQPMGSPMRLDLTLATNFSLVVASLATTISRYY